jgi:hypothetical protein
MDISEVHRLARSLPCDQFEQQIKSRLTGIPSTAIIDCDLEIVVKNIETTGDVSGALQESEDLHTVKGRTTERIVLEKSKSICRKSLTGLDMKRNIKLMHND